MLEKGTQIFQREKHSGKGKNYISVHNSVIINICINNNLFIVTSVLGAVTVCLRYLHPFSSHNKFLATTD